MTEHNHHVDVIKLNHLGEEVWRYPGEVIKTDEKGVLVEAFFNIDDRPFHGITLRRDDRYIERYYPDRWYNIFEIHDRDDDHLKAWYCNITSPANFEPGRISSRDLALDVLIYPNGEYLILDEDEFEALNLDPPTRQKALQALQSLIQLIDQGNLSGELV